MARIDILKDYGTELEVIRSMPQSTKKFILRGMPRFMNPELRKVPQLSAEIALGEYMIEHRGTFGTVAMPNGTVISRLAFDAGKALSGKNYGGLTYDQRLKAHQRGAQESINRLKKIRQEKSAEGVGTSFSVA